jgi:hypothetical protein
MKRSYFFVALILAVGMTACIKNEQVTFVSELAEFDATSWNANAAGLTYPIMTRVPIYGAATPTSSFTIHRTSGTVRLRVNMIGPTSKSERTVGYKLFDVPDEQIKAGIPTPAVSFPATPAGQTPARAASTLAAVTAVAGTHYTALGNSLTIPADSTWGYISLSILDAGPTAGQARVIGIALDSTGSVKASPNYRKLAIAIDQR